MKPVLVFVLTFLVATAASTGAKVMMTKPPAKAAGADSTKTDSTKTDSTARAGNDSTHADTAAAPSGLPVRAPGDTMPVAAKGDSSKALAAAPAAPAAAPAPAAATPPDTVEKRIAKVFTSMDPKQAAKVLEHMTDGDVEIILGYVGVKQAASIMAELPPERVATLSKMAIKGVGGGK